MGALVASEREWLPRLPSGLSRECAMKSQAKFSPERAKECIDWIEEVLGKKMDMEVKDQIDFGTLLKDGSILCQLINAISPGSVKKINTMKAPFSSARTSRCT